MTSNLDFEFAANPGNEEFENRIKRFSPDGLLEILQQESAAWDATPFHDRWYLGHQEGHNQDPLPECKKWIVEKSLETKLNVSDFQPGKSKGPNIIIS